MLMFRVHFVGSIVIVIVIVVLEEAAVVIWGLNLLLDTITGVPRLKKKRVMLVVMRGMGGMVAEMMAMVREQDRVLR